MSYFHTDDDSRVAWWADVGCAQPLPKQMSSRYILLKRCTLELPSKGELAQFSQNTSQWTWGSSSGPQPEMRSLPGHNVRQYHSPSAVSIFLHHTPDH